MDKLNSTECVRTGLAKRHAAKRRFRFTGMATIAISLALLSGLSGGQQQRLCIARTIAVGPKVIPMDEPASALDPIATAIVEEINDELRENDSIAIVTHSMQQTARESQRTACFHLCRRVEMGDTDPIFTNPRQRLTQDYITGRFG